MARICWEAGGRAAINTFMRDMDLPVPATDKVVDGLPLFGGCQLAIDTTLVCAMHCDGSPHQGAAERDGVVLTAARRRKERRYPELVGPRSRARLVFPGVGSWGQVVIRDEVLPCSFGKGTVSSRGATPPETCRKGLALEVGSRMCLCQGGRRVAS